MGKQAEKKPDVMPDMRELKVFGTRRVGVLYMRMELASADFEDGRRISVSHNINGDSILIQLDDPEKKAKDGEGQWVTYAIPMEQFVKAAMKAEEWE